jgi:hypothetical protein
MSEDTAQSKPPDTRPGYYAIRVKGHLDPRWSEWLEGLTVTQTESGETILSGPVVDQSALHGLLARIRDLNLTLISVTRVEPKHPNEG